MNGTIISNLWEKQLSISPGHNTALEFGYKQLNFSGHESFPFRYTWLPKAVIYTSQNPTLFLEDDALVVLGVGKNMVASIRHWAEALNIIYSPERGISKVTILGARLFSEDGWDPYLEYPGTLWLFHWLLSSQIEKASTWYLAFTRWHTDEFSREDLIDWLLRRVEEVPNTRATRSSLKRDVDVFIRTYVVSKMSKKKLKEDSYDCPLVELGLIQEIDSKTYKFNRGLQPALPDEIFIYALLDYYNNYQKGRKSISFENILLSEGSPGAAFKLSENGLSERLERLPQWTNLMYDDTSGMRTLVRIGEKEIEPLAALEQYFSTIV